MITNISTPPTEEPVTLAEAKAHIGLTHDSDDDLVNRMIQTAREEAESFLRGSIMPQTIIGYLDCFADVIDIPFPPLRSVDSIQYVDSDGALQTLDTSVYEVDLHGKRVYRAYGQSWPTVRNQPLAITIIFQSGYADSDSVPAKIKSAILLLVGEMYENREEQSIGVSKSSNTITAERLLWPLRDLR